MTDESHLHIVDSRSTRRKFDLKVQKLEKQKLAAERRRQTPKQLMKPSELPKIEIPNYIERGPSDILRYFSNMLKKRILMSPVLYTVALEYKPHLRTLWLLYCLSHLGSKGKKFNHARVCYFWDEFFFFSWAKKRSSFLKSKRFKKALVENVKKF